MWHDGNWKGEGSSYWRITHEAIAMMDDELIKQTNSTVGENDILYHLGDFAMPGKNNYYHRCRQYRDRIKCRNMVLIWGNHDERRIWDLFSENYDLKMISVPGLPNKIVLCHYAMAVWDKSHRQAMQLYGHSHSEAESWLEKHMPNRRSMDVGVDNANKLLGAFRPFSLDDIKRLIDGRPGHNVGDHHIDPSSPTEESLM
jgi:calcineurin-like phosphoesterase family protein